MNYYLIRPKLCTNDHCIVLQSVRFLRLSDSYVQMSSSDWQVRLFVHLQNQYAQSPNFSQMFHEWSRRSAIRNPRWPVWLQIGLDVLDLFSRTTALKVVKLDWNVPRLLYNNCMSSHQNWVIWSAKNVSLVECC